MSYPAVLQAQRVNFSASAQKDIQRAIRRSQLARRKALGLPDTDPGDPGLSRLLELINENIGEDTEELGEDPILSEGECGGT